MACHLDAGRTCRGGHAMSPLAAAMAMLHLPPAPRPRSAEWLAALKVDPRQAIEEERIICLICGGAFRQLTNTHLQGHQTSAADYKRKFGHNRRRPLLCRWLRRC